MSRDPHVRGQARVCARRLGRSSHYSSRSPACLFRDRRGNVVGACLRDATHRCSSSGKIVCDALSFPHLVLRALTQLRQLLQSTSGQQTIRSGSRLPLAKIGATGLSFGMAHVHSPTAAAVGESDIIGQLRDLGSLVPGALPARRQPASWFSAGRLAEFRHSRQRMLDSASFEDSPPVLPFNECPRCGRGSQSTSLLRS